MMIFPVLLNATLPVSYLHELAFLTIYAHAMVHVSEVPPEATGDDDTSYFWDGRPDASLQTPARGSG